MSSQSSNTPTLWHSVLCIVCIGQSVKRGLVLFVRQGQVVETSVICGPGNGVLGPEAGIRASFKSVPTAVGFKKRQ